MRGPEGMGGCATRSPARNTSTVDSVTLMLTPPSDEQVAHRAAVPPVGDTHDLRRSRGVPRDCHQTLGNELADVADKV